MKVVLLSGGIDSLVCAELARQAGELAGCVFVDYGQPNQQFEAWKAFRYCLSRGVELRVLHAIGLGLGDMADGTAARVVPHRNAVLIAMACNHAASLGASEVQIGANAADQADYEDCRRDFFIAMHKATGLSIHAPLITKTKAEIVTMARNLGLSREDAWSCYEAGPKPCGECPSCVEAESAWSRACKGCDAKTQRVFGTNYCGTCGGVRL